MLLCGNHSSHWDILFLMFALNKRLPRIVAKTEMRKVPVLTAIMDNIGVIFINRGKADINAVRRIVAALKNGDTVVFFPEGHRLKTDDAKAAQSGAILIAASSGVPIVPVHIPRNKRLFRTNTVTFGEPYTLTRVRGVEERAVQAGELMLKISALGRA
jgi:1-acyl-sn-glycerol-3-phosphate acyltransferase